MATYSSSNITGDTLAAQAPSAVRKMWDKGVEIFEQSNDFWKPFEGTTKSSPIRVKTDLAKGMGQTITFTTMAGLYDEAHYGDEIFVDGDDYGEIDINSNDLSVDYVRHSVRFTERSEEFMGMRGEINGNVPALLGQWLGREKTEKLFMMFLNKGEAENIKFAGSAGSVDDLTSADTLNHDEIVETGVQLERLGGMPARIGKDGDGNPIHEFCVVATTDALYSLELDPTFKQQAREGDVRGGENLMFKGGYRRIRGNIIKKYNPIDHDGEGPIGSPVNPKALLGTAITGADAAIDITGGGSATAGAVTKKKYFKWFPNFAYRFMAGDTATVSTDPFYVAIVNPPDGSANANKFGFYKCVVNDGNKLTITERLSATADVGTFNKDQVGNVEWDATENTVAHPSRSTIILCNANGVPIGHTIMLGAEAARRGYGKHTRKRGVETHEDGFIKDIHIKSVFGQAPRRDNMNRCPAYMVITHAIKYAGIRLSPTLA